MGRRVPTGTQAGRKIYGCGGEKGLRNESGKDASDKSKWLFNHNALLCYSPLLLLFYEAIL